MATPSNVTLLEPYVTIEDSVSASDIDLFQKDTQAQLGVVRAIFSGCTRVAIDDVVLFKTEFAVWIEQQVEATPVRFYQVDEMDIILKSTYVPLP